jgi:sulfite reductase (NADPH) flavoprotein alpha-component
VSAQPLPLPPLSEESSTQLARLVQGLDGNGLWWLSGYAAGLAQARGGALPKPAPLAAAAPLATAPAAAPAATPAEQARLSIVYGSQTGNAKRVAEQLAREAQESGLAVRLLRADAYPLRELAAERLLYLVLSTQGDGDPSDDARGLVEHLAGRRAPRLPELKFAVLGLGDSSYPKFCAVGRQLDARLSELGATRLLPAGEADVEVDAVAAPWRGAALNTARELLRAAAPLATVTPLRATPAAAEAASYGRERPFAAELLQSQRLTGRGSSKDVRHLELSLAGSGLSYEPGDALGVWPRNPDALVDTLLDAVGLAGDAPLTLGSDTLPLREWLAARREVTRLARPLLAAHAERAGSDELRALLQPGGQDALAQLLASHQPLDLLRRWPASWDAGALVGALRPLAPRLYSIASSAAAVGDEAHLTVDVVGYEAFGERRVGAASSFLATLAEGARAPAFIEANERFRLPADSGRDIIMIGPGTGVAPFRGFLQQRTAQGARGRNWLLFGNPHFRTDFLYQVEWQAALRAGTLQRLDLAFSRDGLALVDPLTGQARRTYVQQRLREHGRTLHAWLDGGAHLYVCGATAMGKDVHLALRDMVAAERGLDAEGADEWLAELQRQGRYARDVY